MTRTSLRRALVAFGALPLVLAVAPTVHAAATSATVDGVPLSGATVGTQVTVTVTAPSGVDKVKFLVDGTYLGADTVPPFTWPLALAPGAHELETRVYAGKATVERTEVPFTVRAGAPTPAPPSATPTPTPVPSQPSQPAQPAPSTGGSVVAVRTVAELERALAAARPGTVIEVAAGTYVRNGGKRWTAAADGTAARPITLRGTRAAVLASDGITGDYGLHVTGDHWRVVGLSVREATKGIVLDGSVGTVLDGVDVGTTGEEGVHFRSCSSDGVLRNSAVHDTGLRAPQYGEGVYVGSASSNWSKHGCVDGRDNSERVLVEGNVFTDVPAEGADLKEGTESGTLRKNVFVNVGHSGKNSADSAVDVKGNNWLIEGNVVRTVSGAFVDGFQTHAVYSGYGTGNVFRGNVVECPVPGFGIGLYPQAGNVVSATNTAPAAKLGLVGANGKAVLPSP